MMAKKERRLKIQIPSQGMSQFLAARKQLLACYDHARIHSKKDPVETGHGNVAEAEFRKWLSNFLPKKYAVTSGYVVSPGISDLAKTPHFDVIIYDQIESPVLWIEGSSDSSEHGKSRAIPAEFVKGIIEVKSAFNKKSVIQGITQLEKLIPLLGLDDLNERYKLYLPSTFICGLIFFELRSEHQYDFSALEEFAKGEKLRGFSDGIILRGENNDDDVTGKLDLHGFSKNVEWNLDSLFNPSLSKMRKSDLSDDFISTWLSWSRTNFTDYAFDLLAKLNGTYERGRISSFHAFGAGVKGKD